MIEVGKENTKEKVESKESAFLATLGITILSNIIGYFIGQIIGYLLGLLGIKLLKTYFKNEYKKSPKTGKLIEAEIKRMTAESISHANNAFKIIQEPLKKKLPDLTFVRCTNISETEVLIYSEKFFPPWVTSAIAKRNKNISLDEYMSMVCCGTMIKILKNIKKYGVESSVEGKINSFEFTYCIGTCDNPNMKYSTGDINTELSDINTSYADTFKYSTGYGNIVNGKQSKVNKKFIKLYVTETMKIRKEFIEKIYKSLESEGAIEKSKENLDSLVEFINTGK